MLSVHQPRRLEGVSVHLRCRRRGMPPSGSVVNTSNDWPRPQGGGALLIPFVWHLGLAEFAKLCGGVDVRAELGRYAPCWDGPRAGRTPGVGGIN